MVSFCFGTRLLLLLLLFVSLFCGSALLRVVFWPSLYRASLDYFIIIIIIIIIIGISILL
jgi:hypothetical protein